MKRCLAVGAAVILALMVGWLSAYTASRIDFGTMQRALPACREAGHCDAPLWIDFLLLAWCVGPALLFGTVAFVGSGKGWSVARWGASFALLSVMTAGFYCAWYVIAPN